MLFYKIIVNVLLGKIQSDYSDWIILALIISANSVHVCRKTRAASKCFATMLAATRNPCGVHSLACSTGLTHSLSCR